MKNSGVFNAYVRTLERELRDVVLQEQSTFSGQMSQINAVDGSQYPQGLANIANKHALEFARRASEEAPRLVDTTDKDVMSEVESTILISAKRLLNIGSDTMSHPAISQMVAGFRGMATKALDREIHDRLVYASVRTAPGTSATIAWNLLVLISNPLNGDVLTTNSEHRRIQTAVREASFRDQINIHIESATRIQDLFRAINEYEPRVVHFCGHGDDKSLVLLNDQNQAKLFDATHLNTFMAADSGSVELVVFNSCHSLAQAICMLPTVSHVVGTSDALDDASAVFFAESFYSALAYGKSLSTAFKQAKARVAGELGEDYAKVFELRSRPGANPGDSYTVRSNV